MTRKPARGPEYATLLLIFACYGGLAVSTAVLAQISVVLAIMVTTVLIALHSSLQHEVLHGHPTRRALLNEALVFPAVGLLIPYRRFRDLHMAHHHDDILTDPYGDPETNFMDPAIWAGTPGWIRAVRRLNNTLLGRILLGPLLSFMALIRGDLSPKMRAQGAVRKAWLLHFLGLVPVVYWLETTATIPLWAYILSAYLGFGLLKIRTYLEHRAHENPRARSVIIADHGVLAFLFLNNNFHAVHHANPGAAWYRLRQMYEADSAAYLARNEGYFFQNYHEVFARYLLRAKDPVPHPLRGQESAE